MPESESKMFLCKDCNFRCHKKSNWTKHRLMHKNDMPEKQEEPKTKSRRYCMQIM